MINGLDLQLHSKGSEAELTVFLISPGDQQTFTVVPHPQLKRLREAWLARFLRHHDPNFSEPPADVVRDYGLRFCRALEAWLSEPQWAPLQHALEQHPGLPLRIRCSGSPLLEQLPWESLPLQRPIWRLAAANEKTTPLMQRARQPRLLLVVGAEQDLDLGSDIQLLEKLQRRGRIQLCVLRGMRSSLSALRAALLDPAGWDGLIFLGHSDLAPESGGRLQLGDGGWLAAGALQAELEQAASHGLPLVLLNSCSGVDLAHTCLAAGIPWALCFREPVPTAAASLAFHELLDQMEQGRRFSDAVAATRARLENDGPVDSHLLLSAFCTVNATDLQLPLRRRRQFQLRLATSQQRQLIAAGVTLLLATGAEIEPNNPLSTFLLDRRLYMQGLWRGLTHQPGPRHQPLPVLLLEESISYPALGVQTTPGRVSRAALAKILELTPPQQVPRIALDLVLDEPAPATASLTGVIRQQQRSEVVAGFYGAESAERGAGSRSMPLEQLRDAGLQARDLATGTVGGGDQRKPVPLQLRTAISADNFAGVVSGNRRDYLPVDAVIDWSLPWSQLIRKVSVNDLPNLRAPLLLVGSDGRIDRDRDDLFQAPGAVREALPGWGGSKGEVPGVIVQAVLAQSLALQHWLTPLSLAASTGLAAGLGVLIAAVQQRRGERLIVLGGIILFAVPLSLQLAVQQRLLLPLALPIAAIGGTALLRRN